MYQPFVETLIRSHWKSINKNHVKRAFRKQTLLCENTIHDSMGITDWWEEMTLDPYLMATHRNQLLVKARLEWERPKHPGFRRQCRWLPAYNGWNQYLTPPWYKGNTHPVKTKFWILNLIFIIKWIIIKLNSILYYKMGFVLGDLAQLFSRWDVWNALLTRWAVAPA